MKGYDVEPEVALVEGVLANEPKRRNEYLSNEYQNSKFVLSPSHSTLISVV